MQFIDRLFDRILIADLQIRFHLTNNTADILSAIYTSVISAAVHRTALPSCDTADIISGVLISYHRLVRTGEDHSFRISRDTSGIDTA